MKKYLMIGVLLLSLFSINSGQADSSNDDFAKFKALSLSNQSFCIARVNDRGNGTVLNLNCDQGFVRGFYLDRSLSIDAIQVILAPKLLKIGLELKSVTVSNDENIYTHFWSAKPEEI